MTRPVIALLGGEDLGETKSRTGAANLGIVVRLDDEGKAITTATETRGVEYRVATDEKPVMRNWKVVSKPSYRCTLVE